MRDELARALDMSEDRIRVIAPEDRRLFWHQGHLLGWLTKRLCFLRQRAARFAWPTVDRKSSCGAPCVLRR